MRDRKHKIKRVECHEDAKGNLVVDAGNLSKLADFLGLTAFSETQYLYKYYGLSGKRIEYLLDSIRKGYLWYSQPIDLNDPFDCKGVILDYKLG